MTSFLFQKCFERSLSRIILLLLRFGCSKRERTKLIERPSSSVCGSWNSASNDDDDGLPGMAPFSVMPAMRLLHDGAMLLNR